MTEVKLRRTGPDEASVLSDPALTAWGFWGYDREFIESRDDTSWSPTWMARWQASAASTVTHPSVNRAPCGQGPAGSELIPGRMLPLLRVEVTAAKASDSQWCHPRRRQLLWNSQEEVAKVITPKWKDGESIGVRIGLCAIAWRVGQEEVVTEQPGPSPLCVAGCAGTGSKIVTAVLLGLESGCMIETSTT